MNIPSFTLTQKIGSPPLTFNEKSHALINNQIAEETTSYNKSRGEYIAWTIVTISSVVFTGSVIAARTLSPSSFPFTLKRGFQALGCIGLGIANAMESNKILQEKKSELDLLEEIQKEISSPDSPLSKVLNNKEVSLLNIINIHKTLKIKTVNNASRANELIALYLFPQHKIEIGLKLMDERQHLTAEVFDLLEKNDPNLSVKLDALRTVYCKLDQLLGNSDSDEYNLKKTIKNLNEISNLIAAEKDKMNLLMQGSLERVIPNAISIEIDR